MTGTASQAATVAPPCELRIHQGAKTPPRPGTTIVNMTLRTIRLSVRGILAHAPSAPAGLRFSDTAQRRNVTSLAVGDVPPRELRGGWQLRRRENLGPRSQHAT